MTEMRGARCGSRETESAHVVRLVALGAWSAWNIRERYMQCWGAAMLPAAHSPCTRLEAVEMGGRSVRAHHAGTHAHTTRTVHGRCSAQWPAVVQVARTEEIHAATCTTACFSAQPSCSHSLWCGHGVSKVLAVQRDVCQVCVVRRRVNVSAGQLARVAFGRLVEHGRLGGWVSGGIGGGRRRG